MVRLITLEAWVVKPGDLVELTGNALIRQKHTTGDFPTRMLFEGSVICVQEIECLKKAKFVEITFLIARSSYTFNLKSTTMTQLADVQSSTMLYTKLLKGDSLEEFRKDFEKYFKVIVL